MTRTHLLAGATDAGPWGEDTSAGRGHPCWRWGKDAVCAWLVWKHLELGQPHSMAAALPMHPTACLRGRASQSDMLGQAICRSRTWIPVVAAADPKVPCRTTRDCRQMHMPPGRLQDESSSAAAVPRHAMEPPARLFVSTIGLQDSQTGKPRGCWLHQGHRRPVSRQSAPYTAHVTQGAGGGARCRRWCNPTSSQQAAK